MAMPPAVRTSLNVAGVVVLLYVVTCGALFAAMFQSPDDFARTMKHVPELAFRVYPFRRMWFVARKGHVQVGDLAPDFSLETPDQQSRFQLSSLRGQKPTVLVFGSYTCPPFRHRVVALNPIYKQYKDKVSFYMVYIREAHTTDVWQDPDNLDDKVVFLKPKSFEERARMGQICTAKLGLKFPAVVDTFDNATERAYTGWPIRLYVIDSAGRVVYKSKPGPYGFHPEQVAQALEKIAPVNLK